MLSLFCKYHKFHHYRFMYVVVMIGWLYLLPVVMVRGQDDYYDDRWKFDADVQAVRQLIADGTLTETPDIWAEFGLMYLEKDKLWNDGGKIKALECFDRAILVADSTELEIQFASHLQKGVVLQELGRGIQALAEYDLATNILQDIDGDNYFDLATILKLKGDVYQNLLKDSAAAVGFYSQSIEYNPCDFFVYWELVNAEIDLNRFSQQDWIAFKESIENVLASFVTVNGTKSDKCQEFENSTFTSKLEDSVQQQVDKMVDAAANSPNSRPAVLYWTLFVATDRAGDIDLAWKYLELAHTLDLPLLRNTSNYVNGGRTVERLAEHFSAGFWPPRKLGVGSKSTLPVFIVGFFRSGSTLLETMLDSHREVWGMGEESVLSTELVEFQRRLLGSVKDSDHRIDGNSEKFELNAGGEVVREFSDRIVRRMRYRYNQTIAGTHSELLELTKRHVEEDIMNEASAADKHAEMENIPSGKIPSILGGDNIRQRMRQVLRKKPDSANFKIVDKMLGNYWNIGLIHLLFPDALIIHTMRDPLDSILSCYKLKFASPGAVWTLDIDTLTEEYVKYLRIMEHFRKELPGRVIDVSYESLVAAPEATLRAVIRRLGLNWDPNVLNFAESQRTVHTASKLQVRRQLYRSSVGGWRKYADQMEPLIEALRVKLKLAFGTDESFKSMLPKLVTPLAIANIYPDRVQEFRLLNMNWMFDRLFNYSAQLDQLMFSINVDATLDDVAVLLCLEVPDCSPKSAQQILGLMPTDNYFRLQTSYLRIAPRYHLRNLVSKFDAFLVGLNLQSLSSMDRTLTRVALLLQRGRLFSFIDRETEAILDFNEAISIATGVETLHDYSDVDSNYLQKDLSVFLSADEWLRSALCWRPSSMTAQSNVIVESLNGDEDPYCKLLVGKKVLGTAILLYYRANLFMSTTTPVIAETGVASNYRIAVIDYKESILLEPFDVDIIDNYVSGLVAMDNFSLQQWTKLAAALFRIIELFGRETIVSSVEPDEQRLTDIAQHFGLSRQQAAVDEGYRNSLISKSIAIHTVGIYWALASIASKMSNLVLAWKCLAKAHSLEEYRITTSKSYNWKNRLIMIQNLTTMFKKGFWPKGDEVVGSNSTIPVFIVGFFRSGSSLLDQMLSRHLQIASIGENSIFAQYVDMFQNRLDKVAVRSKAAIASGESAEQIKKQSIVRLRRNFQPLISKLLNQTLMDARLASNIAFNELNPDRVIDKMLGNYWNIGLIHLLFPKAVILHTMRDPLDTLLSCYKTRFGSDQLVWTLREEPLVAEYVNYLRIMEHFRKELPGRVIDVSYESLVAAPEATLRAVIRRLGLNWDPNVLNFAESQRTVHTASKLQVRRQLYRSSVGGWRKYADQMEPLIEALRVKLKQASNGLDSQNAERLMPKIATPITLFGGVVKAEDGHQIADSRPKMNWKLDRDFDYDGLLESVQDLMK